MKRLPSILLLALALTNAPSVPPARAARVSEPSTVFYGRVVQRLGTRSFPVTQGRLEWTLASGLPGAREHRLTATLSRLGDGSFQYVLRIPHQLLAYDLTTDPGAVPLTAAPMRLRHLRVTVDGQAAVLVAPTADGFTADQTTRAAAHRIDLEVNEYSPDSDGDGFPDWWEDRHGTDKWDPTDSPLAIPPPPPKTDPLTEAALTGFAQWRALYFPNDPREPAAFAAADSDGDHVGHWLEYAFGLDPRGPDETTPWLPAIQRQEGRIVLTYGVRRKGADLAYLVEISDDLLTWRVATPDEIEPSVGTGDGTFDRHSVQLKDSASAGSFLRVRVNLKP